MTAIVITKNSKTLGRENEFPRVFDSTGRKLFGSVKKRALRVPEIKEKSTVWPLPFTQYIIYLRSGEKIRHLFSFLVRDFLPKTHLFMVKKPAGKRTEYEIGDRVV